MLAVLYSLLPPFIREAYNFNRLRNIRLRNLSWCSIDRYRRNIKNAFLYFAFETRNNFFLWTHFYYCCCYCCFGVNQLRNPSREKSQKEFIRLKKTHGVESLGWANLTRRECHKPKWSYKVSRRCFNPLCHRFFALNFFVFSTQKGTGVNNMSRILIELMTKRWSFYFSTFSLLTLIRIPCGCIFSSFLFEHKKGERNKAFGPVWT